MTDMAALAMEMLEADDDFRSQFNPESELYHAGDTTRVQINAARVLSLCSCGASGAWLTPGALVLCGTCRPLKNVLRNGHFPVIFWSERVRAALNPCRCASHTRFYLGVPSLVQNGHLYGIRRCLCCMGLFNRQFRRA